MTNRASDPRGTGRTFRRFRRPAVVAHGPGSTQATAMTGKTPGQRGYTHPRPRNPSTCAECGLWPRARHSTETRPQPHPRRLRAAFTHGLSATRDASCSSPTAARGTTGPAVLIDRSSRVILTDNGVCDPRPDARAAVEISATAVPAADDVRISGRSAIAPLACRDEGMFLRQRLSNMVAPAAGNREPPGPPSEPKSSVPKRSTP
jgi:hypothetical protein